MWFRAAVFKKGSGSETPDPLLWGWGPGGGRQRGRETEKKQIWQMLTIVNLSKSHISAHVHLFCEFKIFQNKKLGK